MTEPTPTEQDLNDIKSLGLPPEDTTERSLLAIWSSVLSNVAEVAEQPIPINVALKVVSTWPFLSFQDTAQYHTLYHLLLGDCRDIVDQVIAEHPGATQWTGELDAENNHPLYKEILVSWHMYLDDLESAWLATAEDSHIQVAVIADTRAFFFSQVGFAGHLDSIGFKLGDDEFLEAVAKARGDEGE